MSEPQLIRAAQLAKILALAPATIKHKRWKIKRGLLPAGALPEPLDGHGTRTTLWALADVEEWVNDRRPKGHQHPTEHPPTPKFSLY